MKQQERISIMPCLLENENDGLIEPCSEFKGEKLESSQSSCPYVIVFVLFWHVNCSR